jgi:uncharacterized protein (TIGR02145 family)
VLTIYFHRSLPALIIFFLAPFFLLAEGTKQLKPDTTHSGDLHVITGGVYSCFATEVCPVEQKLLVTIKSPGEKIYLGFGNVVTFRIKLNGTTLVYGPKTTSMVANSPGHISYYKQAIAGPNVVDPAGYNPLTFAPGVPGNYSIDFNTTNIPIFDITVVDTTLTPLVAIDGRLWSKDWGLVTSSINDPLHGFLATLFVLSDDSIVTSINFNGMQGDVFDVTSTPNGCFPPPIMWDTSCRSRTGNHHYAQYKIFVNDPDSSVFPTGTPGAIFHDSISVTPHCDGTIEFGLVVNKNGNIKINIEVNPLPGHQPEDVSIIGTVIPGANTITWNGLDGLGNAVPPGDSIDVTNVSYVNGLTNLALFDVEKHLGGFMIQLIRPPGPPIVSYWNDTLLAFYGGQTQLNGCTCILPSTGCHTWNGSYFNVGIGSFNTVNTWWYASGISIQLGKFAVMGPPVRPDNITGPAILCHSGTGTYTVVPDPIPGALPNGYEWVLKDVTTGVTLFDSVNRGSSITIDFSSFPPGNKRLKVRGSNAECGLGVFGPGTLSQGILITLQASPEISNTVNSFSQCSGISTNILFQCTFPSATYSYTATATSATLSGYAGGTSNPLQQTLINSGIEADSVIYKVVPFAGQCFGDTALFYVRVDPPMQVTNTITAFQQCSGVLTNIVLTSDVPGSTFTWTASGSSPGVTGYFDSGGGAIAQPLANSVFTTETVTYNVIPSINGCTGSVKQFTVSVFPVPDLSNNPPTQQTCSAVAVVIPLTSHVAGSTFTWTAGGSSPSVIGYLPGNGMTINQTLINSGWNNENVTYSIIPSANGCAGSPADYIVTVHPVPDVYFTPAADTICSNKNCLVSLLSHVAVSAYSWTASGSSANVSGFSPGNGSTISQPLSNSGFQAETVTYTVSPSASGCPGIPANVIITVNPFAVVSFVACPDNISSTNGKPIRLRGGLPYGGTYSGPGVDSLTGIFYPTLAGSGNHTIYYAYTNMYSCRKKVSMVMTILNPSSFTCGNQLTDIRNGQTYPTVHIGSQCWTAANLNYGNLIPGSMTQRDNCIPEKYCYNDLTANCQQGTVYYQWDEIIQYDETISTQGLCPPGWHVPSEGEWSALFANFTNSAFAAWPLLYSGYSGFNAEVTGTRHLNRTWDWNDFATFFWTSDPHGSNKAWAHGMNETDPSVSLYPAFRSNAFSVRCLKD